MTFKQWFEESVKVAGMLPYKEESFGSQLEEFMKEAYKAGWNAGCNFCEPDEGWDYDYVHRYP